MNLSPLASTLVLPQLPRPGGLSVGNPTQYGLPGVGPTEDDVRDEYLNGPKLPRPGLIADSSYIAAFKPAER